MSRKHKYYMRGIGVGILVCALILIIARINMPATVSDDEIISRARALGMVDPGDLSLSAASDLGSSDNEAANGSGTVADADQNTGTDANDTGADQNTATDTQGTDTTDSGEQNTDQNAGTDTTDSGEQNTDQGVNTDITDTDNTQNTETDTTGTDTDQNTETDTTGTDADQNTETDTTDTGSDQNGNTDNQVQSYAVLVIEKGNSSNVVADKLQALGVIQDSKDFDRYLVDHGYANRISVGTFQIPYDSGYEFIAKTITHSL